MVFLGNLMMDTSKVADIIDSKAVGIIAELVTMVVKGVITGVFMVAEIADHIAEIVAKMIMSIEIKTIPMPNANLFKNNIYLHLYKFPQL